MFIGWDKASKEGDYSCKVYGEMDYHGEWHITKVKCNKYKPIKEVKKLSRPYFEMKVVKVKKKKEYITNTNTITINGYYYEWKYQNGTLCLEEIKPKKQPKGNWVNGENLDKIKFPCFCRFGIYRNIGILNANRKTSNSKLEYKLYTTDQSSMNGVASHYSLKEMITKYNIHILKGKIIIYEEEK